DDLARRSAVFLRFADHTQAADGEWRYLAHLADELRRAGYAHLAELVGQRVGDQPSLLVVAVRFFFRVEIENDPHLFQGLAYEQLDRISHGLEAGFAQLGDALRRQGERLETLLESVQAVVVE